VLQEKEETQEKIIKKGKGKEASKAVNFWNVQQSEKSELYNTEKKREKKNEEINEIEKRSIVSTKESKELENVSRQELEQKIFVPNVFTPNNDGKNDRFEIKSEGLEEFSITILSEQNKVVYSSVDTSFFWDGIDFYQIKQPEGRYVYYIIGKNKSGVLIKKSGFLFLKR